VRSTERAKRAADDSPPMRNEAGVQWSTRARAGCVAGVHRVPPLQSALQSSGCNV